MRCSYATLSEEEIKLDRYAKFRALGQFEEHLVPGGQWREVRAARAKVHNWCTLSHLKCLTLLLQPVCLPKPGELHLPANGTIWDASVNQPGCIKSNMHFCNDFVPLLLHRLASSRFASGCMVGTISPALAHGTDWVSEHVVL